VIRELLVINLQAKGYETLAMASGHEALEMFSQTVPDLILLDVMMPDIDGWEVLKIVRDHFEPDEVKILMLTAKNTERDKLIGKSILKADEYVTKPFDLPELFRLIEDLLGEQ